MKQVQYKRLYLDSSHLRKVLPEDAGYDLPGYGTHIIAPGEIRKVGTGIAVAIPLGFVGLVVGRSGNAFRQNVFVPHVGTIDSGYEGEIMVLLENRGKEPVTIEDGTYIAQLLVLYANYEFDPQLVTDFTSTSTRGANGFGSTGGSIRKMEPSERIIPREWK